MAASLPDIFSQSWGRLRPAGIGCPSEMTGTLERYETGVILMVPLFTSASKPDGSRPYSQSLM